jgi:hypothetical protein
MEIDNDISQVLKVFESALMPQPIVINSCIEDYARTSLNCFDGSIMALSDSRLITHMTGMNEDHPRYNLQVMICLGVLSELDEAHWTTFVSMKEKPVEELKAEDEDLSMMFAEEPEHHQVDHIVLTSLSVYEVETSAGFQDPDLFSFSTDTQVKKIRVPMTHRESAVVEVLLDKGYNVLSYGSRTLGFYPLDSEIPNRFDWVRAFSFDGFLPPQMQRYMLRIAFRKGLSITQDMFCYYEESIEPDPPERINWFDEALYDEEELPPLYPEKKGYLKFMEDISDISPSSQDYELDPRDLCEFISEDPVAKKVFPHVSEDIVSRMNGPVCQYIQNVGQFYLSSRNMKYFHVFALLKVSGALNVISKRLPLKELIVASHLWLLQTSMVGDCRSAVITFDLSMM